MISTSAVLYISDSREIASEITSMILAAITIVSSGTFIELNAENG